MRELLNRLQIRHFRLIQAITETGQLSIAAERLSITQPAASRTLRETELLIGMPLFERHPKGMLPTPIGTVLARHATGLLHSLEETAREVRAFGAGRTGTARVGSVTGGAVAFVVPAIQALKKGIVGADIHVDIAPSDALMAGLSNGDYDFVLSRVPPGFDARHFEILRGRIEDIEFLVRPGHPLVDKTGLTLADLAGYDWVIQAPGTPLRQAVEEAFLTRGITFPTEIVNSTSLLVTIAYLWSSDAIAPVSLEVAELLGTSDTGGRLRAFKVRESIIVSPYHLIQRKNQVISPLAQRLRDLVLKALSEFNRPEG